MENHIFKKGLSVLIAVGYLVLSQRPCAGYLDPVQTLLSDQYNNVFYWEPVAGKDVWLNGKPVPIRFFDMAPGIALSPSDVLLVRMAPRQILRIMSRDTAIDPSRIQVSISNGSGLHAVYPVQKINDRTLVFASPLEKTALCRITYSERDGNAKKLAFYLTQPEAAVDIAPYRKTISTSAPLVNLTRSDRPGSKKSGWMQRNEPVLAKIKGPARLMLETRLVFSLAENPSTTHYSIHCLLDGRDFGTLEFETTPQRSYYHFINQQVLSTGRLAQGYLEIGPGDHELTLSASSDCLGTLVQQEVPDYLLPTLNEPRLSARKIRETPDLVLNNRSAWTLPEAELDRIMSDPFVSPALAEMAALRLVSDNSRRHGGLIGTALMDRIHRFDTDPDTADQAKAFADRHTYYADLFPEKKTDALAHEYVTFLNHHLEQKPAILGRKIPLVVEPHLKEILTDVQHAFLNTVPPSGQALKEEGVTYALPERPAPGMLRIIARKKNQIQHFMVQIGDSPPVALILFPEKELPLESYALTTGEAGLALAHQRHSGSGQTTLGGVFSAVSPPGVLIDAGTLTLDLPGDADQIRVWQTTGSTSPLEISFQYKASKRFFLTPDQYQTALKGLKNQLSAADLFFTHLAHSPDPAVLPTSLAIPSKTLVNFWQPLFSEIKALDQDFRETATPLPPRDTPRTDLGQVNDQKEAAAQKAMDQQQWIPAFELWADLFHTSRGDLHARAVEKIMGLLDVLDQKFLAEKMAKSIFLSGLENKENGDKQIAFNWLADRYSREQDTQKLLSLYANRLMRDQKVSDISLLADLFLKEGRFSLALMCELLVPDSERNLDRLFLAGINTGWDTAVSQWNEQTKNRPQKNFWDAVLLMKKNDYLPAYEKFTASTPTGLQYAGAIQQALAIQEKLNDPKTRTDAVLLWEKWQKNHPGNHLWQEEPWLIKDFSGVRITHNPRTDLSFKLFAATAEKPLKIEATGPVVLKVEARLSMPDTENAPPDTWIHTTWNGRDKVTPLFNNLPSKNLTLVGAPRTLPGIKQEFEIPLGPGLHTLDIYPEAGECLVRIFAKRPEIPIPILPPLTPATLTAVFKDPVLLPLNRINAAESFFSLKNTLVVLPLGKDQPPRYIDAQAIQQSIFDMEKNGAFYLEPQNIRPEPVLALLSKAQPLIGSAGESDPTEVAIISLLYHAQAHPETWLAAEAAALKHYSTASDKTRLRPLIEKFAERTGWDKISMITESAGIRNQTISGWQPENDAARIRKALRPKIKEDEHILFDHQDLMVDVTTLRAIDLDIELVLDDLLFLPPEPMTVFHRIDTDPEEVHVLSKDLPIRTFQILVPKGVHRLTLGMKKWFKNQLVRVRIREAGPTAQTLFQWAPQVERQYHVATRTEPIKASVKGPAWIRIQERVDQREIIENRFIEDGWHPIVLYPSHGKKEALFRLSQRVLLSRGTKQSLSRPSKSPIHPLLQPMIPLARDDRSAITGLEDSHDLPTGFGGYYSLTTALKRRRNFEEDIFSDTPEDFLELNLTHRYFSAPASLYFKTDLIERFRRHRGVVTGLAEQLDYKPDTCSFRFSLDSSIYFQDPVGAQGNLASPFGSEIAAYIKGTVSQYRDLGPKTFHIPQFSVFGRYLSLENPDTYPSENQDQDIYSSYKNDHKTGISIGDTLTHRPWIDTLWYTGGNVDSNENMNLFSPDRISFRVGWKQKLDMFQAEAGYQFTHSFSDGDRPNNLDRHYLDARLTLNKWQADKDRFQIGLRLNSELTTGKYSASIQATWFFNQGNGLKHFNPSEIDFYDLEKRHLSSLKSNRIVFEKPKVPIHPSKPKVPNT